MFNDVLIDNWLLQDLGGLYQNGLSGDTLQTISLSKDGYGYENKAEALIQLDALFSVLIDVVTRDTVAVDQQWVAAWQGRNYSLDKLAEDGVIRTVDIDISNNESYERTKDAALQRMCYCPMISNQQQRNEMAWDAHRRTEDPFFSQMFWGTAGNLGRGNYLHVPYNPHPLRAALLDQLNTRIWIPNAQKRLHTWMKQKRNELFAGGMDEQFQLRNPQVLLDPVIVDIIEASSDASDLIPVAMQMRDDYRPYRELMQRYQQALLSENAVKQASFQQLLKEVDDWLLSRKSSGKYGGLRVSIPLWIFGYSKNLGFEQLTYRFGARAVLKKMMFQPAGGMSLKRLLRMFQADRETSALVLEHYSHSKSK